MIRPAVIQDIPALVYLIGYGSKFGKVLNRTEEDITTHLDSFLVWELPFTTRPNFKVIGCVALDVYSPRLAEIRSLVVDPQYQKNGIGGRLIKAAIERAKFLEISEVLAITDRIDLFAKTGFKNEFDDQKALFIKL